MALEAVVYPQDPFSYCPDYTAGSFLGAEYGVYPLGFDQVEDDHGGVDKASSHPSPPTTAAATASGGRRKRRRVKSAKNREEIENQRMTHIAVERNRRKQMNEYLAVLRSLMPPSHSQRVSQSLEFPLFFSFLLPDEGKSVACNDGDQASIIGGAINFVKELEQLLQSMETQKQQPPFSDFFSFPQYSATRAAGEAAAATDGTADIEVTMVESHANLKIQSRRQPKQLIKLVSGLQSLQLGVLHLNVTSSGDMVLYTASVKVEEGCHLTTVDEIAAAVNQMLRRIEDEADFS
ncbi:hypothetical protein SAY86_004906 [Trapa natans]|uniref:BHLH domain-containing protein n=1 Tax=Trapa natans TaxID=22666 RepID=A0AAN7MGD8_TRANT|nr:hypothetical protein SAY86_004906 [Trapa natans]